jgi:hypothetical protein
MKLKRAAWTRDLGPRGNKRTVLVDEQVWRHQSTYEWTYQEVCTKKEMLLSSICVYQDDI